jgi:hypothetical protein
MAGRPPGPTGVRLTEAHRAKIQNSNILNRLISHAEGNEDMTQTQVTAALGLLKKALPDLSAVSIDGEVKHSADDTIMGLLERIASNGKRINDKG